MAVIDVREIKERQHSVTLKNERRYTRTWKVITDNLHDGGYAVELAWLADTGIYQGQSYQTPTETDSRAKALTWQTNCVDPDGLGWEVTCNYGQHDGTGSDTNPLNEPVIYSSSFSTEDIPIDVDAFGSPIVNSAGQFFAKPLTTLTSRWILTAQKNEAWPFNGQVATNYMGSTNGTVWNGWPLRTVLCRDIRHQDKRDATYGPYITVTYTMEFNTLRWVEHPLDAGYQELNPADPTKRRDILKGGQKVTQPAPLNGFGYAKSPNDPPQWLTYYNHKILPFGIFTF